jgi:hypothetical protein
MGCNLLLDVRKEDVMTAEAFVMPIFSKPPETYMSEILEVDTVKGGST